MKEIFLKILKCIPAVIMISMIFTFSAKNAEESSEESNSIASALVEMVSIEVDDATLSLINDVVREMAHFTEFFLLGCSCYLALTSFTRIGRRALLYLILFCIAYAISDEVHQLFVPGRCLQLQDIIVDSLGATTAILICKFTGSRIRVKC